MNRGVGDGANLAVAEVLLGQALAHEAHAAHPLDAEAADAAGDLGGVELGHGGVLDEVLAGLLLAGGVVDQGAGGGDLGVGLGELVLHALELADEGAELLAVVPGVLDGVFPGAEREAGHLGGDADAALVEDADGVLVALAALAEDVVLGDDDVVEVEDAGAAGADAELLLLLGDGEALGALVDDEGGDALVALGRVEVGEDEEDAGLDRVCDPHLGAVDDEAVGGLGGARGHGEGVGAGDGLGEAEGGDGVGGEAREVRSLDVLGSPLEDGGVAERVVDVAQDADAGVGARELLNGDDGRGEVHAGAAVLLGDLDAHEALLEELLHNGRVHGLGLVHLAGLGQDDVVCESGDGLGHGGLDLGEPWHVAALRRDGDGDAFSLHIASGSRADDAGGRASLGEDPAASQSRAQGPCK
ncbi:Protein kinase C-like protein [Trichoderma cornu-damae]|uniref:Protein kinase C-like protein n=1 Tax=Trichoderma cornu-damae TaxID=654480 RepID=A0A9P8TYH9_9HYPO|nr:Protein kinase C-like protein [Trichoderma cornu-damae]